LFACFFLGATNIVFLFLPVIKFFSYESAVVNAVLITFLSGLSFFKSLDPNSDTKEGLKDYLIKSSIYLVIPILIYFSGSLLTQQCSFTSGFKYFVTFCLTAPLIGAGISSVVLFTGIKFKKTIFTILFLLLLFNWIVDFYLYPQFFLFNAIFTYYPGVIYDEFIPVTDKIVFYRIAISIVALAVIIAELKFRTKSITERLVFGILIIMILPIISYYASQETGLVTLREKFTEKFKDGVITPHFLILSEEKLSPAELEWVANLHEAYYGELVEFYKTKPPEHLQSVIFKDSKSKKLYLGVENADVAKPWLRQAYTTRGNLEKSLKHELAHLFTAEFGWSVFKVAQNFNPGLIEGAATAADGVVAGYSIDDFAVAAYNSKYKVAVEDVFPGFGFFDVNPTLAYVMSGSFSKFLIDKSGIEKFKEYYLTGDFFGIYKKELRDYTVDYEKKLSVSKSEVSPVLLDFYFDRKPLIRKTCPRYFAEEMVTAAEYFRNKEYGVAVDIYSRLAEAGGGYATISGKVNSLMMMKQPAKALEVIKSYEAQNPTFSEKLNLQLLKFPVLYSLRDSSGITKIAKVFADSTLPDFLLKTYNFYKLLLDNGHDPFFYGSFTVETKIKTLLAIKEKQEVVWEVIVDLLFSNMLPFPESIDLNACTSFLSESGKLKLCTILVRSGKPEKSRLVVQNIAESKLTSAQEISKYRIFRAVFGK